MTDKTNIRVQPTHKIENLELSDLLQYATGQYAHHIDWVLRHKDTGIQLLAAAIAADSAVVGLCLSDKLPAAVGDLALFFIAAIAFAITRLAVRSCFQAYRAALEHAALIAKVISLGGMAHMTNDYETAAQNKVQVFPEDPLFVPRYLNDMKAHQNADAFVEDRLRQRGTGVCILGEITINCGHMLSTVKRVHFVREREHHQRLLKESNCLDSILRVMMRAGGEKKVKYTRDIAPSVQCSLGYIAPYEDDRNDCKGAGRESKKFLRC